MQQRGWDVTYLPVKSSGLVDMRALEAAMRPDTAIVSVMLVNNEIGARPCLAGMRLSAAAWGGGSMCCSAVHHMPDERTHKWVRSMSFIAALHRGLLQC